MVNHYLPTTLDEVLERIDQESLTIIAGGTDIMVQKRSWANTPPRINGSINIINIPELKYIEAHNKHMHIGSTTSLTTILAHPKTPDLLKQAIRDIASPALRNIATIAGNIGNASPAGDTLPILYALNAIVVLKSKYETRLVPIHDVITGPRKTIIEPNELITEIILPLEDFTKTVFHKVGGRKADAISKVSFTGAVKYDKTIKDIRICFGAVGPVMVRSRELEETIIGTRKEAVLQQIDTIVKAYEPLITPIDDQRSNKQYRLTVALNLLRDFLTQL